MSRKEGPHGLCLWLGLTSQQMLAVKRDWWWLRHLQSLCNDVCLAKRKIKVSKIKMEDIGRRRITYWSHEDCTRGFLRRINSFNLGRIFIGAGHVISFRAAKDWSLVILQSTSQEIGVQCTKGTSRVVCQRDIVAKRKKEKLNSRA